ncbi:N-alpha-acetyltransferase 30 [Balamuthia mandrillaris]
MSQAAVEAAASLLREADLPQPAPAGEGAGQKKDEESPVNIEQDQGEKNATKKKRNRRKKKTKANKSSNANANAPPATQNKDEQLSRDTPGIRYDFYKNEDQMPEIMALFEKDLSEPYSIFTYRYFIGIWPKLCVLAHDAETDKIVGSIVCKLDSHRGVYRGYIAMLAVDHNYRKRGIGSVLVMRAIDEMKKDECEEVVLETEVTNKGSLALYEKLGFIKDKRLCRYYLNGVDAFRLKIFLNPFPETPIPAAGLPPHAANESTADVPS